MGASASSSLSLDMTPEVRDSLLSELLAKCEEVLSENPDNRCCKHAIQYLNSDEGKNMSNEGKLVIYEWLFLMQVNFVNHRIIKCQQWLTRWIEQIADFVVFSADAMTFYKCIRTGVDNPDSGLGCYAMTPTDYSKFGGFFDKVIRDYHGDESGSKKHETDWDTDDAD